MKRRLILSALAALCGSSIGCQTQMGGMTLPSPHYLEHRPQYFPEEPDFPLQREKAYQEEISALTPMNYRNLQPGAVNPVPGGGLPR